jgi:hypothetical protein
MLMRYTCQKAEKVVDGDLGSTIVDSDVAGVEIGSSVSEFMVDPSAERIASIAGHVVCQHEDYMCIIVS